MTRLVKSSVTSAGRPITGPPTGKCRRKHGLVHVARPIDLNNACLGQPMTQRIGGTKLRHRVAKKNIEGSGLSAVSLQGPLGFLKATI